MGKIIQRASAGTLESSDVYVEVGPGSGTVTLDLDSVVALQFGDAIRRTVLEILDELGVADAELRIVDRGALDCVLRARVETAVRRGEAQE
jgi:citrate lyase subunit gamma (acyl carrier protein)